MLDKAIHALIASVLPRGREDFQRATHGRKGSVETATNGIDVIHRQSGLKYR